MSTRRRHAAPCRSRFAPISKAVQFIVEPVERRMLLSISPIGSEFLVNTYTTGVQFRPAIAADGDGDFIVAWASNGQDGSSYGVYAQRYSSTGVAQLAEFRVNTYTTGNQLNPAVAADADGDFVIAWHSNLQDGSGTGVYAQRYNAAGVAQGAEFLVNTYTTSSQNDPSIAMDAAGNFVIAWESFAQDGSNNGIYAQRYDAAGGAQGGEFRVNSYTTNAQEAASVAMDNSGNFVVTWDSNGQDGAGREIYTQRYNASGVAQGLEFRVNSFTTGAQRDSSVGMDADGDFVVAWNSNSQDGSYYGAYAQRYNAAGVPQGSEFRVNTYTTEAQTFAKVSMDDDGDFVVAWGSNGQDGNSYGVYTQAYRATGVAEGIEFRVNTYTTSQQAPLSLAMDDQGDFVVAWQSLNQDGSNHGIYSQRYDWDTVAPVVSGLFANGRQLSPYEGHPYNVQQLVVSFSENMNTTGGTSGANSVTNPANWQLTRNGSDITGSITSITFAFNATTNRYEATLNLSTTHTSGNFGVMAKQSIQDLSGNALDGDFDGTAGGNFLLPFSISFGALGSEFRANNYTTLDQQDSSVATDADGNFVVVWESDGQDGSSNGIYGQRYNAAGVAQGSEFRVNTYTTGLQVDPEVAMDDAGNFVVVWRSPQDGTSGNIYGQRYNAAGLVQGGEFQVNTFTTGFQLEPDVAMDPDGNFVVVWTSNNQDGSAYGVYGQRYNAAGAAQGAEFRVNTYTTSSQRHPSVAMDGSGDFVVAWDSFGQDGHPVPGQSIYVQRYNASGAPQGAEFRANTYTTNDQTFPSVAMDDSGDFVITWQSDTQDLSGYGVYGQRYNAAGAAQGAEFRANIFTMSGQLRSSVAMDTDGNFVVLWESLGQDGSQNGVYAQRYNSSGMTQGTEFRVNTYTTNDQWFPSVAMDRDGDFVVAWQSDNAQDGSGEGIFTQRYGAQHTPSVGALADSPDPVAQGNMITLNATSVTGDNPITLVQFYRESNGQPGLQFGFMGDTSVGSDSVPTAGVYSLNLSTAALAAGTYTYWAQAVDSAGLRGIPASTSNTILAPPPAVTASGFLFETLPQKLSFSFDQDVSASLSLSDITVQDLTHSTTVTPSGLSYVTGTNTATVTFSGILVDANYRATLSAAGITNSQGTPMAANHILNFFFLMADANHDQNVNLNDFNILAANFGLSPRNFSQADFNYDGMVNLNDFNILAGRFGSVLGPDGFGATRIEPRFAPGRITDSLREDLLA